MVRVFSSHCPNIYHAKKIQWIANYSTPFAFLKKYVIPLTSVSKMEFRQVRRWITHTGGITHTDSSIHYYKTHIFWDTLLQHTHFPTHIISTYIIPIQIYFGITSIWVYNQTHTYLSINVFTHTAICIQTHIYFRIWLIWPHIIQI